MFNITNYFDHPTRPGYTIFKFNEENRAIYFKQLLTEQEIWFEESIEENYVLFGVRKGDFKAALNANFLVSGKHRKKTIPNKYLRWFIYLIAIGVLTLAIISWLKH